MISFVLLFAVAFGALPTTKQTCEAVPGAKWTPTAGSTTEGTCGCDTGFTVDGDKCKCAAADQFIIKTVSGETTTYNCGKCTDGKNKIYDPKELKCTDWCGDKFVPNAQNVCESCGAKKYISQHPLCADKCFDNMVENDGVCSCKEGYFYHKETKKCYAECPEMSDENSGLCMVCGKDYYDKSPKYDTQSKSCVDKCAEGATEKDNKCTCPSGKYPIIVPANNGPSTVKCQACDGNKVFVAANGQCADKAVCKAGQKYMESTNLCVCGDGMEANTGADSETKPCKCTAAGTNIIKEGDNYVCKKCEGATPKYDAANFKCVKDGVNGLFVVLAMALFFLF